MLRKGFTLIELLIVITIIAILAGAAIPYVQDYVEDARITTAKADMNEIKNALTRYELDRGTTYTDTTITPLVGAYLGKAISDPWGMPYLIIDNDSQVRSWGSNRADDDGLGDDINVDFRAPLAVTKAYFVDADNSATVTTPDSIRVRFSRPASVLAVGAAGWGFVIAGAAGAGANMATTVGADNREAVISFTGAPAAFLPGRDAIYLIDTPQIQDLYTPTPANCNGNEIAIKSLK